MRITEGTRFPHPVLAATGNDFTSGKFDVNLEVEEKPMTGALRFHHEIVLTEPGIESLVTNGRAAVGCFVRCNDTYYTELRELGWPNGTSDFVPGSLLNRVTIRPLIWLKEDLAEWNSGAIHPEFGSPVSIARSSIIAVGVEKVISVGMAKLTPMESIFELSASDEVPDGLVQINPDADRITVFVNKALFQTINVLRGQNTGRPLLLNAIYLPAVIEVLDALRANPEGYRDRRWYQPFRAKCDAHGIDFSRGESLLTWAQTLLGYPARELARLVAEDQ